MKQPAQPTRLARVLQLGRYGAGCAGLALILSLLGLWAFGQPLTRATLDAALGWGGTALAVIAGATVYSQSMLGMDEVEDRARLGQGRRLLGLPLDQIVVFLMASGLLLGAQALLVP